MRAALVDVNTSFYDRHWAFALSATLRQSGVKDLHYVSVPPKPRFVNSLLKIKPDLVLYSAFSYSVPEVIAFDACLKSVYKCKSVLGGPGPTFAEIDVGSTTLDAVCIGEGEVALQEYLASGMKSGRNLITRENPALTIANLVDLSEQPMPDRSVVYASDPLLAAIPSKAFMTGRGCPYHCTYCFNHAYNKMFGAKGTIVRKRPVAQVLEEIQYTKNLYPLNFVSFQDDTFCIDKRWLEEFSKRYSREIGLPFACNVRANLVDDDVVRLLKEAGVRAVSWSVESANDVLRNEVLKRQITKEQMELTARLLRKYRVPYRIANIIGIPGETAEQVTETMDYNVQLGSAFTTANVFTPYPRLELTEYAVQRGYLDPGRLKIPKNFFEGSALKGSRGFEDFLIKSYCLLPFFVWFPKLWRSRFWRAFFYGIPKQILRPIYELTYLVGCKVVYGLKTPLPVAFGMAWRYIKGLL